MMDTTPPKDYVCVKLVASLGPEPTSPNSGSNSLDYLTAEHRQALLESTQYVSGRSPCLSGEAPLLPESPSKYKSVNDFKGFTVNDTEAIFKIGKCFKHVCYKQLKKTTNISSICRHRIAKNMKQRKKEQLMLKEFGECQQTGSEPKMQTVAKNVECKTSKCNEVSVQVHSSEILRGPTSQADERKSSQNEHIIPGELKCCAHFLQVLPGTIN